MHVELALALMPGSWIAAWSSDTDSLDSLTIVGDPHMSNEEFDRKMAFIVEQQAQFAADVQQLQACTATDGKRSRSFS
jgi:hypothetical protein